MTKPMLGFNNIKNVWKCLGVKVISFWHLHLGIEHITCNSRISPYEFKLLHAEIDIVEEWLFFYSFTRFRNLWFSIKIVCLFNCPINNCVLFRTQILQLICITYSRFWVLGFIFSATLWLITLLIKTKIMLGLNNDIVGDLIADPKTIKI